MGESFRKTFPEVVFPHRVNQVSFLEGWVRADVYTSRGRILVTGFQFHSKNSMAFLGFRQIYDIYTGDCRFITTTVIHTIRSISKSCSFRNVNDAFCSYTFRLSPIVYAKVGINGKRSKYLWLNFTCYSSTNVLFLRVSSLREVFSEIYQHCIKNIFVSWCSFFSNHLRSLAGTHRKIGKHGEQVSTWWAPLNHK